MSMHPVVGRLRFKVAVSVFAGGLLMLAAFTLVVLPTFQRNLRAYEMSRAELYATMVARTHGRSTRAALVELERMAMLPDIVSMDRGRIDPMLTAFDATTSSFVHFAVFDPEGAVVSRPSKPSRIGDRTERPHVAGPLRAGRTFVAPVRITRSGNLSLTVGTPVRRQGTIVGILSGALGLPDRNVDLYRDILDPPLPPAWKVWLVSAEGTLIALSGASAPKPSEGIIDASAHPGVAIGLAGPRGAYEYDDGGYRWIAAAATVDPVGWHVIATVPEGVIDDAVAMTTQGFAVVGLITITGLIAVTVLLASRLSRRLEHLTSALTAYGAGVDTPVATGGDDEIGEAIRAFNRMVEERRHAQQEHDQLAKQSEGYLKELLEQRTQRLRESQDTIRSREEFISVAAHELNTPLMSLLLMLEGLRRGVVGGNPEQLQRVVELAERQGRKLAALVDMLLGVGRSLADRPMTLRLETIDLAEIARDSVELVGPDLQRSGSTVSIHAEAAVMGRWDRRRVEQIFTNLLGNAIKFGKGKPIDVTITQRDGIGRILVADHGIGIPADRLPAIFERFERGVPSSHYGGFGLGLFIVREIVRAHGGTVGVDSIVGEGTTFTIDLPCEGPPSVDHSAEPREQGSEHP